MLLEGGGINFSILTPPHSIVFISLTEEKAPLQKKDPNVTDLDFSNPLKECLWHLQKIYEAE